MLRYMLRRFVASLAVLFLIVTGTFFLIKLAPGGLSILTDPMMDPETARIIAANLGLDQPAHVQYGRWLSTLARGDFGQSLSFRRPVMEMILDRLPNTLLLSGAALLLTILVGIPLGIVSARRQYSATDQLLSFASFLGLAMPGFWLGILLIILFSVVLGWLPSAGMVTAGQPPSLGDRLSHLIMPAFVLAAPTLAETMRYTRSSWLELVHMDFVRVARAKGLSETAIQLRHILQNSLIPIVTFLGLFLPRLVSGAAIVETLFSWPGMGSLAVDAATRRDAPLVMGVTIMVSLAVILSNLVIDLLYPMLDPRLRTS
jgi:peptide/nickel transport system permease protein